MDFSIGDFGGVGLDGHTRDAYGIEVRAEKDPRAVIRPWSSGNEVGPTGQSFIQSDLESQRAKVVRQKIRHGLFAPWRNVGISFRIDRRDSHQFLQEFED